MKINVNNKQTKTLPFFYKSAHIFLKCYLIRRTLYTTPNNNNFHISIILRSLLTHFNFALSLKFYSIKTESRSLKYIKKVKAIVFAFSNNKVFDCIG